MLFNSLIQVVDYNLLNINIMRKIVLLFILAFTIAGSSAQLSLENYYPVSANIIELEKSGFKYYTMDILNKQSQLYNMDHSIFKVFDLVVPDGYYLYNVQFVSEHLFNSDDLVELVYTYSMYNETETGYWWYTYETRIINENGTELLKIPGAGYTDVLDAGDDGRKFLVWIYDYSVLPAITHTNVYSLPDHASSAKSLTGNAPGMNLGNPFPNPSSAHISVPVSIPYANTPGILNLYDMNGNLVKSLVVSDSDEILQIPSGTLLPGTYMINLNSGDEQSTAKKVIIK